ncbi:membrane protein [hydrothermal vent metagenome]|uniref:Membrane protein n=1 Tax=hydrothermal vent metagenome TaxID=652676 RepID=A0A1W1EH83_9ZZZZ
MKKSKVWAFALLTFIFQTLLYSNNILKNDFITYKAGLLINEISNEAKDKLDINIYTISSNEMLKPRSNLFEYLKSYENNMSKPYIAVIFIPRAKRVGVIPSSSELIKMYNSSEVKSAMIDVVASVDKNSLEDKYNIALVQGVSELADEIAKFKNIKMEKTIPNDTKNVISIFRYIVYVGTLLVLWIFLIQPFIRRRKHGK